MIDFDEILLAHINGTGKVKYIWGNGPSKGGYLPYQVYYWKDEVIMNYEFIIRYRIMN